MTDPQPIVAYQVPVPGTTWVEEERGRVALVIPQEGREVPFLRTKVARKRVEVLASSAATITRARVHYVEHTAIERVDQQERQRPSPLHGRRYVLDAPDGQVTVVGEGGAPVSPEEEAAIREEERRFGRPETLGMVLAGLRYRPGEPVTVPHEVAARLFPGDLQVTLMEVTLVEAGDVDATFTLRLGMHGVRAGVDTQAELSGTLRVDRRTAQPAEMRLVGPLHSTGAMTAEGTLEMVATRSADA